jgi:hypothetical protein
MPLHYTNLVVTGNNAADLPRSTDGMVGGARSMPKMGGASPLIPRLAIPGAPGLARLPPEVSPRSGYFLDAIMKKRK